MGKITQQFQRIITVEARTDGNWYHRMIRLMAIMTIQQLFRGKKNREDESEYS